MFRHHGLGSSRALHHDLPGEVARIALPPLWTGTVLAHQPSGDPAPTGTPPAVTPPAPAAPTFSTDQQAYIDQLVEGRLARDRQSRPAAPPNLAELQQKAQAHDALLASVQTDQQRAAAEALAQGTTAGRAELLPQLVAAEIRAASGGTLTPEQAAGIVAPLNPAYFQAADGTVDAAKVAQYVTGLPTSTPGGQAGAGAAAPPGQPGGQPVGGVLPPLGQGRGAATPAQSDAAEGVAEAKRRHGEKAGSFPLGRPLT